MGLIVVGLCLFLAGVARAEPAAEPSENSARVMDTEPEYDDYRLTLVASDLAAISLVVSGVIFSSGESENEFATTLLIAGGATTYALGGPIIHLTHEQTGRAFGSFGLRVGVPSVGLLVGFGLAASCDDGEGGGWCAVGALFFGLVIGLGGVPAAMIIDDAILGKAPKPAPSDKPGQTTSFRAGLAPLVDPKKRALGLSLVGAF